jgi:uncharacterized membrane protein
MKTTRALAVGGLMIAAALLYTLILYPHLPDLIPIHWNWRGEVDGWADKRWAVLLMPGTMALMLGLLLLLPALSPGQLRIQPFRQTFNYIMILATALMGFIHVVMLQAALNPHMDMGRPLISGIFLFFALIGNVLGKIRRNAWAGIRTPWTLADDRVWASTHRLAGQLWVGMGIFGVLAVWIGIPPAICFTLLMVAVFVPVVYSYLLYKRLSGTGP